MLRCLLLCCVLLLGGCSLFLEKPQVALQRVELTRIDSSGVQLELLLAIDNPNRFALSLDGYRYDLRVQGVPLVQGEGKERVTVPANGRCETRLPVRVGFRELGELLRNRPDVQHIPYELTADLHLVLPIGSITLPVSRQGEFSLPSRFAIFNLSTKEPAGNRSAFP